MLTPDYLNDCADVLLGYYDELERTIIADIARRIVKTGKLTATAEWQMEQLRHTGMLLSDVTEQVAKVADLSEEEVNRLFQEAGVTGMRNDAKPLILAGKEVDIAFSPEMTQIIMAAISKTNADLRNLTMTTGVTAMGSYTDAANEAVLKVESGAFSYDQAIRDAIKKAAQEGNYVSYASGHRDKIDVAVRRSVLTGLNQTAGRLTEIYSRDLGAEYYETSAHAGARPSHAVWQGRIFKIEGATPEYPNFEESTGYGTGEGLCGWNCRHSFYPFFPGLSVPAYTQEKLDWYDAPRFKYNGDDLTEYEVSQLMRRYERSIRASKRELVGYNAAIEATTDLRLKDGLRDDFERTSVLLKQQEAEYKDLCRQTRHKTDRTRTQVHAVKDDDGRIVSFNRSVAQKARRANERFLEKYSDYHYTKSGTIKVTDDWKESPGKHIPGSYRPYAVIETTSRRGKQIDRTIYDEHGRQVKQISNGPHSNPKWHPYGTNGEHVHDITWDENGKPSRPARDLTEQERREHSDIL